MLVAVLSGFAAALLAPWLYQVARGLAGWILAVLPLSLFLYFASFAGMIGSGETIKVSYGWAPSLGVNLSFTLDGLSLLFAMLVSGIGALIVIYGGGYLSGHPQLGRFYAYVLMFMASMLGVVLSNNLFSLFVFWELTSLSSYLLIGFNHEEEASRSAALQALLVTGGGGLAMLAGLVLLNLVSGTAEISEMVLQAPLIQSHGLYLPILLLILVGAFSKSAQAPFHFWLPAAMEAPTPVSAYLHSATMVKAGVYLLARMSPVLGGTLPWTTIVTVVGAVTMLVGAYLALCSSNMKRILAYTTISSLGTLVLLLGIGTSIAIKAAMVFLLAHALYKGALFMMAGAVYHESGTQDVDALGGLRKAMPITALVAGLAAISLAGFGPLLSFIGKELLLEAVLEAPRLWLFFTLAAVLAGAVNVAMALAVGYKPFFGAQIATPKHVHEAPLSLWIGPGLLASLGIVLGVFPALASENLIAPSVQAVYGEPVAVKLTLWHGWTNAFSLSLIVLLAGGGLFWIWEAWRKGASSLERYLKWGSTWWYFKSLDGLNTSARAVTRLVQSGRLHHYLTTIILTTVGLVGYTILTRGILFRPQTLPELRFYEAGLAVMILLAALASVRAKSRLASVAALGVVGFGVALTFILFGAPDLAMTQLLIETMTVILLVLVLYHLPGFARLSTRVQRRIDAIIALGAGAMMTLLVMVATSVEQFPPISSYFAENSYRLGHGRNIVNVILVDFRALDTMGEITVLSLAGVGVFALLKLRLGKERGPGK
jgi:multicomponent Na+:H+ antiporter subunit A